MNKFLTKVWHNFKWAVWMQLFIYSLFYIVSLFFHSSMSPSIFTYIDVFVLPSIIFMFPYTWVIGVIYDYIIDGLSWSVNKTRNNL